MEIQQNRPRQGPGVTPKLYSMWLSFLCLRCTRHGCFYDGSVSDRQQRHGPCSAPGGCWARWLSQYKGACWPRPPGKREPHNTSGVAQLHPAVSKGSSICTNRMYARSRFGAGAPHTPVVKMLWWLDVYRPPVSFLSTFSLTYVSLIFFGASICGIADIQRTLVWQESTVDG